MGSQLCLDVVTGTGGTIQIASEQLLSLVDSYSRVVIDLGTGDGKHAYRQARTEPSTFYLALDPDIHSMKEAAYRASRKPSRGGLTNIMFVRAAVEDLPVVLTGLAHEIQLLYPWGSLLRTVLQPDMPLLNCIAQLGRAGAKLNLAVNMSALSYRNLTRLKIPLVDEVHIQEMLLPAYTAVHLPIYSWRWETCSPETSWAGRLSNGQPFQRLCIEARVEVEVSTGRQAVKTSAETV